MGDKSMGGCPPPMGGSEMASGEDICEHSTWTEECGSSQISCDAGYSNEGCWFGNVCIDSVSPYDSCPGICNQKALAHRADRQFFSNSGSGSGSGFFTYGSDYGSDYGFNY